MTIEILKLICKVYAEIYTAKMLQLRTNNYLVVKFIKYLQIRMMNGILIIEIIEIFETYLRLINCNTQHL